MVCERSSQRPPRSLGGEGAVTVRETWWVCGEQGFGLALRDDRRAGRVGVGHKLETNVWEMLVDR